jgi:signal transduction histidine kinase
MKIRLVSRDRQVEKLCREGLAGNGDADCSLYLDPQGQLDVAVDLSILDLDSFTLPYRGLEKRNGAAPIVLLSQERLDAMRGRLPAATILLKPVRRELFLTALGCAVAHFRESSKAAPAPAAAGEAAGPEPNEELLQSLLHTSLELQRAHARQMHFLARGLHDLRAPLTAIEGYSGLLLAERFGPLSAAQRENLRRMQQSIARLTRMTTDIFRLSLGERGEHLADPQPGDIELCLQRALDEMLPYADARQIRLDSEVAPPAEPLSFDDAQIHSVLTNLLENACRFTPRGGSIEVRGDSVFWERRRAEACEGRPHERRLDASPRPNAEPRSNAYRVDIRDCGPGVPAGHLNSIFEPYTSYAGSQDRAGSGLGLAICRMVIGAHRGRIFVESGEGGAVFSFVLPFAEPLARPERRPIQPEAGRAGWPGEIAEETA